MLYNRGTCQKPHDEMTDMTSFSRRLLTQRELDILDHLSGQLHDFHDTKVQAKLVEALSAEEAEGPHIHIETLGAWGGFMDDLRAASFQAGQVDGFRLACRLLTRLLSGKIDEFHNVTPEQLPLHLAGALTDDAQASELIGRIVAGQL